MRTTILIMLFTLLFGVLFTLACRSAHAVELEHLGQQEVVAHEILVKMRPGTAAGRRDAIHRKFGATLLHTFTHIGWQHVRLPAGMSVAEGIAHYQAEAEVTGVEANYRYHASALPNDPDMSQLWGLQKIAAPAAWNISTGSSSIVVAVVDSGINYQHVDLSANIWHNPAENTDGYTNDLYGINAITGTGDPLDDAGHGTHVAGIIGAVGNNGVGVAGVDWVVKLMALKFLDATESGSIADAVTCYDYLIGEKQRGVNIRVVNASWSGSGFSQSLLDAINAAGELGMVTVCAAGNDGVNIDTLPEYPAAFTSPYLITVTASDSNDNLPSYANFGPTHVALAAPGVNILSTYSTSDTAYLSMSGSSMATAYVSGAAALLAATNSSLSVAAIKAALLNSVDLIPQYAGLIASGGRLNLDKALLQAGGTAHTSPSVSTTNVSPSPLHSVAFSATPASPLHVNTTISMTAADPDVPTVYQFQVLTVRWYGYDYAIVQRYGTNPTVTWRPARAGSYYLRVLARAVGSTSNYDVLRSIPVTVY